MTQRTSNLIPLHRRRKVADLGRWDHRCPSCNTPVRWALTYCYDCGEKYDINPAWNDVEAARVKRG